MKKIILAFIFMLLLNFPAFSATEKDVQNLIGFYVKKFTPEKADMIASGLPDENNEFNDLYMSLNGIVVEDMRLDTICVRMTGVKFNAPSEWANNNVEFDRALQIYGYGKILEKDINEALKSKTFGENDDWHDISIKITPAGLYGKGYYHVNTMLLKFDILIEITSGLKIVANKQIWLDHPVVKINRLDVPETITNKALADIQPILDLNRYPDLPIKLNKIEFKNGEAILSTKIAPKKFDGGLKYKYAR